MAFDLAKFVAGHLSSVRFNANGKITLKEEVPMDDVKRSLEERLKAHPHLRKRFDQILGIADDSEGNIDKADEAEQRMIDELGRLGQEILEGRAVGKKAESGGREKRI
jgi:hypothetical protein